MLMLDKIFNKFLIFAATFLIFIYCESSNNQAKVAQLVEHDLAKVGVAGSNPVSRSFM